MLPRLLSPHIRRAFRTPTTTTRFAFSRHTQSKEARPKAGKQERSSVPPLAFVFDIDGVLLRGPDVLPTTHKALKFLHNNPFGGEIPFVLLTNGGGVSEKSRSEKLTRQLDMKIAPNQFIQSHTVLKTLAQKRFEEPVLILGGQLDAAQKVAEEYGFKKAYTTADVLAWNPSVWPFYTLSPAEQRTIRQVDFSQVPISAVFIFHDPRNWGLDVQILCDVIQSGGIIGNPYVPPSQQISNPIEVVFCNPDLLWQSDFPRPRLGQGAFKEAFQAVYKSLTGVNYPYVQYGKPSRATYKFAEQVLTDRVEELYGVRELPHVYMIGDNPESDIAGANAAGWSSVLVHTGVYDPQQGPPTHRPTFEAEHLEQAICSAIDLEWVDAVKRK